MGNSTQKPVSIMRRILKELEMAEQYVVQLAPGADLEKYHGERVATANFCLKLRQEKRGPMTNKEFCNTNHEFFDACKKAEVTPSTRQASKFRMKKGAAYRALKG